MKGITPAATAALVLALPAFAETETYTVDPNHTFPAFEIGHMGYSIQRGRFNKTSGKITLDSAAHAGTADITIDTASISTGHPKLEEHLRSEEFFDAAKFPALHFKADRFEFDGEKVKAAPGTLTMHGVTRPVTLKAEYFSCGLHPMLKKKMCGADFSATIKRSEFGITRGVPAVADDVNLRINVEALKD